MGVCESGDIEVYWIEAKARERNTLQRTRIDNRTLPRMMKLRGDLGL